MISEEIRDSIQVRTRLKRAARFAAGFATHLMSRRVRTSVSLWSSNVLFLSIYRHKNAPLLAPLVAEAKGNKWETRLWALDRIFPALASYSRGAGGGSKFSLLNALINGWSKFDWIIVADDDVVLERGSLTLLLGIAEQAKLSLVQPGHSDISYRSYDITLWDPLAVVRLTTFVEIGPIFAFHRAWFSRILPFPTGYGMGWGLDVEWSDLRKEGARLGIVDLVTIRHLVPPTIRFADSNEPDRLERILREHRVPNIDRLQHILDVWRPWQRNAPWLT